MRLCDFPFLSNELVQFICNDLNAGWQVGAAVTVQIHGNEFLIRQGDIISSCKAASSQDRTVLQVQQGLTLWVLRNLHEKTLYLQSLDLIEQIQLDMAIAVDEAIAEQLATRKEIPTPDVRAAIAWMREQFISLDDTTNIGMDRVFLGRFENESDGSFVLFGADWRCTVKRDIGVLKLTNLTRMREAGTRLAMATGKISFEDTSVAVRLQSTEQRALLDAALRDNGSYLRLWEEYGALEWEQARDCARELGSLPFKGVDLIEGELWAWSLKVEVNLLKDFRKRWKSLGLPQTTQVELGEEEPDFDFEVDNAPNKGDHSRRRRVRGKLEFRNDGIFLTPNQDRRSERPPTKGFIYYSLSGDEAVQTRRARAKQSISNGRRMPQLRYLLEGVSPPIARRRHLDGLSTYAKACFKGAPTERQKLALDVAINTPDIALIVGPPGTGKTQVIAALQRRLAETLGDRSLQHQVLVSSFQHDAVDNALNRAEVFGLPAVRIGGRGRRDEGGVDPIGAWCERKRQEIALRIEKIRENEPLTQPLEALNRLITSLKLARFAQPERVDQFKQVDTILRQLDDMNVRLPAEVRDQWSDFLERQIQYQIHRTANKSYRLIQLTRGLRISPIGFADDGADRVHILRRALQRENIEIEEFERLLLERLSMADDASEDDLSELAAFKVSMLSRLNPDYRPPQLKHALSSEALGLLTDIEKAIDAPLRQSRRGISSVVAAYYAALLQAPNEAARAVQEYASIVGATCQQSAGKAMSSLKELSDLDATEGIEFDTVVVDEAARANPLDLFVPMAMARRRIILVGDHRQLPHLVQRELEDELISRQSLNEAQAIAYEQSLFERLVKQLREQEKIDNIKRVVMLDTQYRMHPTLGDFVSKQFYESEGLDVLHSGRPAQDFAHTIPGYRGKCAAWVDVPLQDGKEEKRGFSRIRVAEARAIAKEVKLIADACGPTISIGVISFYRAQCDVMLDEFVRNGLAEEEDGEIRIAQEYRQTESGDERLRVGTVDAFQGKEFDVVFLSIVRANDQVVPDQKKGEDRERLLNAKYGHLRLANRLNVAMSRQRKLLIAVGDRGIAEGPESEVAVPALNAFLKLCREEMTNVR